MANILYISLTGMAEALGKSQVLEYLYDLSKDNKIFLISYERENDLESLRSLKKEISQYNIYWEYITYSNKYGIFSTISQLFKGVNIGSKLIRKNKITILHARSMIPALMCLVLKKIYGSKLLFDIRDFSTDEKVDRFRITKGSLIYKILMYLEVKLYKSSDYIVALTYLSKNILNKKYAIPFNIIDVIPTCASKEVFYPLSDKENKQFKKELGFNEKDKILIHSGSVTGWYMFEEEVLFLKKMLKYNNSIKLIVLNKGEHEFIKNTLIKHKINLSNVIIKSVAFHDVNKYLNISDASIYFIRPTFSKKAAAPTKFAELVACHIPSITNKGIGDMDTYFREYKVGHILNIYKISNTDIQSSLEILDKENISKDDYNLLFEKYFNKNMAVKQYSQIYKTLDQGAE